MLREIDGQQPEQLKRLNVDEIQTIFSNGRETKVKNWWSVETANQPWKDWFANINAQFTFEQYPLELTVEVLHMAIAAWKGEQMDWARLLDRHMRRLL